MKKAERIERLQDRATARAEKAQSEADRQVAYVEGMTGIMNGQPILVGHHSEKRHRRDLERMDTAMHKGAEMIELARQARHAAENVRADISIEDDDARELLEVKIADLQAKHRTMKETNRILRSKPRNEMTPEKLEKFKALGVSEKMANAICCPDLRSGGGFAPYLLTNLRANIKRLEGRLIELDQNAAIEDNEEIASGTCEGNAWRVITDKEDRRLRFESVQLLHDACKILRSHGFKWSPTRNAWIRLLNANAINAVRRLGPALEKLA